MYNKRLKNRAFKTNGPLQKMIDAAVDERMTALKSEHDAEWSDWMETKREQLDDGRTKITEGRQGTIPGEKDDYSGEGGYAPDDVWNEWLQTPDGIAYTEKHSPQEVAEERVRFLEAVPDQIEKREVQPFEPIKPSTERDPEYVSAEMPDKSLASIFNLNPDRAGGMSGHAKEFFDMEFSVDNPAFDALKDDKFMKKARKEYNKKFKNVKGYSKQNMPFERWVTSTYRPGGSGSTILGQARQWQDDNPMHDDGSHYKRPDGEDAIIRSGSGDTGGNRNRPDQPNWYDKAEVEGGKSSGPQMKRPVTKMLKGRTMAFRKNNMNQAPGFKMKRK